MVGKGNYFATPVTYFCCFGHRFTKKLDFEVALGSMEL